MTKETIQGHDCVVKMEKTELKIKDDMPIKGQLKKYSEKFKRNKTKLSHWDCNLH